LGLLFTILRHPWDGKNWNLWRITILRIRFQFLTNKILH
jgi:hypothetical protein